MTTVIVDDERLEIAGEVRQAFLHLGLPDILPGCLGGKEHDPLSLMSDHPLN